MKANSLLCIDLKTKLQDEVLMRPGAEYVGILRRDIPSEEFGFDDCHYTFVESTFPSTVERRNIHLFEGRHITVTKRLNCWVLGSALIRMLSKLRKRFVRRLMAL